MLHSKINMKWIPALVFMASSLRRNHFITSTNGIFSFIAEVANDIQTVLNIC
jgi:hypothetical protein